jgi:hypothetical protein
MDDRTIAFPSEAEEDEVKTRLIEHRSELIGQLTSIKWATVILGDAHKIKVQGKGSSSGIPNVKPLAFSPNESDSLALAWYAYRHYCSRVPYERRGRPSWSARRRVASWKTV